jgi:hypothetical protein
MWFDRSPRQRTLHRASRTTVSYSGVTAAAHRRIHLAFTPLTLVATAALVPLVPVGAEAYSNPGVGRQGCGSGSRTARVINDRARVQLERHPNDWWSADEQAHFLLFRGRRPIEPAFSEEFCGVLRYPSARATAFRESHNGW